MFIAQVAVDLPNQNAPVLVAHPLGNRHKVNASHYPLADEMVSAIPEGEVGDSCRIPCPIKCLLQASHRYVMVVFPGGREEISRVAPPSAHGTQVSLERRIKIHHAKFMVLGQSIRPDHELTHRPVHVAPLDPQGLPFPRTAVGHQADVVGQDLPIGTGSRGCLTDTLNLLVAKIPPL